jgi:hypothetical protein
VAQAFKDNVVEPSGDDALTKELEAFAALTSPVEPVCA